MVRRVLTRPSGPSIMYILFCDLLPLCEQQHCVIAIECEILISLRCLWIGKTANFRIILSKQEPVISSTLLQLKASVPA